MNVPAQDRVFHILTSSSRMANRCDRSPQSLNTFMTSPNRPTNARKTVYLPRPQIRDHAVPEWLACARAFVCRYTRRLGPRWCHVGGRPKELGDVWRRDDGVVVDRQARDEQIGASETCETQLKPVTNK